MFVRTVDAARCQSGCVSRGGDTHACERNTRPTKLRTFDVNPMVSIG